MFATVEMAPARARAIASAIALAALLMALTASPAVASHNVVGAFGTPGVEGGQFGSLSSGDVEVDQSSGRIYVADRSNNRIQRLDSEFNFERAWGRGVVAPGGSGDNGGSNEVQRVTIENATGGTFALRWQPFSALPPSQFEETPPIAFGAGAAAVQAALEALSHVEPGDAIVSGPAGGPYEVEFAGRYAATDVQGLSGEPAGLTGEPGTVKKAVVTVPTAADPAFEICTVAAECYPGASGGGVNPGGEINGSGDVNLALDPSGQHLYVSDDNARISKFDADGNWLLSFGAGVVQSGGVGDVPTNETQRLYYVPGQEAVGGHFRLQFGGEFTANLPYDASAAQIQAALEALSAVSPGDILVSGPAGAPWTLEYAGVYAGLDMSHMGVDQGILFRSNGGPARLEPETKTAGGGFEVCTVASQCRAASVGGDGAGQIYQGGAPLAVGLGGKVFVGDPGNARVSEYQADGQFMRSWGWGVATGAGQFEVCTAATGCARGGRVRVFGTTQFTAEEGHFLTKEIISNRGAEPTEIAVDAAGVVYASNWDGISSSSPKGPRLERFDSGAAEAGDLLLDPIRSEAPFGGFPAGPLPDAQAHGELGLDGGDGNLLYGNPFAGSIHEIDPGPPSAVDVHFPGGGLFISDFAYDEAGDRLLVPVHSDRIVIGAEVPLAPPLATLEEPQLTGPSSASFSGQVTPGGPPNVNTSYRFEYRKVGASSWTPLPGSPVALGDGAEAVQVEQEATGLEPTVEYEVRLHAEREFGAGSVTTAAAQFFLGDQPPVVVTAQPQARTDTTATLAGTINARNLETTYRFEWGTDASYGNVVPVPDGVLSAADGFRTVTETLTGLEPETTYHYRLVAGNGTEVAPGVTEVAGEDVTFTTRATPPAPPGRAFEMVTPPLKPLRSTVAWSAPKDYDANPAVPSLSGDTVVWGLPFFPLTGEVGWPGNHDRRIIRRTPSGWVNETTNTLPLQPDPVVAFLLRFSIKGTSGDLEVAAKNIWAGAFAEPHVGGVLPTAGVQANRHYTIRPGTGTQGYTPWLDNPDEQVFALGVGQASDQDQGSDEAIFNDDGSAMARWGLFGGLAEDPGTVADEDPSDNQDLAGRMAYVQRAADPDAMPTAPKDLVNECTGSLGGGDATAVPERDDAGTPGDPSDDTLGLRGCQQGELVAVRGATIGGKLSSVTDGGLPFSPSINRSVAGPAATALSDDGHRVFFQSPDVMNAPLNCAASTGAATDCPPQLFVRQYGSLDPDDATVRWISRSRSVAGPDGSYSGPPIAGQAIHLIGAGAGFEGASRDGSVVYFKTNAPLTPDDPNGSGTPGPKTAGVASNASWDLYRYELPEQPADPGDGRLTRVSGGPAGGADPNTNPHGTTDGERGGTLRFLSDDGRRAYFVTGAPIDGADATPPTGGATTPGTASAADTGTTRNLYLFDADAEGAERYRFVAALPFYTGGQDGSPDAHNTCASWGNYLGTHGGTYPAEGNCFRGTPDGSHVVFQTGGRLTGDDSDEAGDVYIYDAEADELVRVSAPPPGAEPYLCNGGLGKPMEPHSGCHGDLGFAPSGGLGGNAIGAYDLARGFGGMRYMNVARNADSTVSVYFESRSQLVAEDANGAHWDTYEWREGELSLISRGAPGHHSWYSGNSVDGRDVFIFTSERIDPREIDEFDYDVYDARVGGGIPYTPPPPPCDVLALKCESQALPSPANRSPGSAGFNGTGNVTDPRPSRCRKGKVRRRGKCVKRGRAKKRSKAGKRRAFSRKQEGRR